jgi:hypothetical protein
LARSNLGFCPATFHPTEPTRADARHIAPTTDRRRRRRIDDDEGQTRRGSPEAKLDFRLCRDVGRVDARTVRRGTKSDRRRGGRHDAGAGGDATARDTLGDRVDAHGACDDERLMVCGARVEGCGRKGTGSTARRARWGGGTGRERARVLPRRSKADATRRAGRVGDFGGGSGWFFFKRCSRERWNGRSRPTRGFRRPGRGRVDASSDD